MGHLNLVPQTEMSPQGIIETYSSSHKLHSVGTNTHTHTHTHTHARTHAHTHAHTHTHTLAIFLFKESPKKQLPSCSLSREEIPSLLFIMLSSLLFTLVTLQKRFFTGET